MSPRPTTHPSPASRRAAHRFFLVLISLLAISTAVFALSVVWTRTINGAVSGFDQGRDVALAPNGDLYVVGQITLAGEQSNIWIRKYNSSGAKLWTRTVDGPANEWDMANGVAVDGAGNVYVVGHITVSDGISDIWIRKFSPTGAKLWTRTVNGPGNGIDAANGAAVDGNDNLYVVGYITNYFGNYDIWIRKYSSNGTKRWTRIVNGSGDGFDEAHDVAVDSSGNLFVVGEIYPAGGSSNIWVRKYTSTGNKLWTRIADGSSGAQDCAYGAAVDADGNLYVVGEMTVYGAWPDIWIRKYNSSGAKLWNRIAARSAYDANARDAAVDSNGAVYVIAGKTPESGPTVAWIRKYSPAGVTRWTTTYAGPDNEAVGRGIAVNATKRIYATGGVYKTGQSTNIWVRKYAP